MSHCKYLQCVLGAVQLIFMSKHVGVVGGGIIGLSCAYALVRAGFRVTLIDRGAALDENCSYGNAGLVVPSHIVPMAAPGVMWAGLKWMRDPQSPFYVKPRLAPDLADWGWKFFRSGTQKRVEAAAPLLMQLNLASRAIFEEWDDELGEFDFAREGLLMLFQTQHALDEEARVVEHAKKLGMPAEILNAQQTAQRDPSVKMDIIGAAYYEQDCHLSPHKLMLRLQQELEKAGANLMWHNEVCDWKIENKSVRAAILENGDLVEADEWVLCGGSWSPQTASRLKLKLPMQAGKGYSLTLPEAKHKPSLPSLLMEARVAVTPMGDSLRVAGTMEIAGLDTSVNETRVQGILKALPRYYPEIDGRDFGELKAWAGLRPCSPDGLPYVGRTAKFHNLSVATGHAMMGLSLGPITGKLIAAEIAGKPHKLAHKLLNADRYA